MAISHKGSTERLIHLLCVPDGLKRSVGDERLSLGDLRPNPSALLGPDSDSANANRSDSESRSADDVRMLSNERFRPGVEV